MTLPRKNIAVRTSFPSETVPVVDTYKNLAEKLKFTLKWAIENRPSRYILKVDDDCLARVVDLARWLHLKNFPRNSYIGNHAARQVLTHGIWADEVYLNESLSKLSEVKTFTIYRGSNSYQRAVFYPKYAAGAAGYILTREISQILVHHFENLTS